MTDNSTSSAAVVIERTFDASVDVIWQMWTVPMHFEAWYGPVGASIAVAKMDVRVGGPRLIRMEMQTPDGPMQMWFAGTHLEVVQNERLVYTEAISDAEGNPVQSPAAEQDHSLTEVRVELEAVEGGTRMIMTHVGIPADSPGAAGWHMAFDKLAVHLGTGQG